MLTFKFIIFNVLVCSVFSQKNIYLNEIGLNNIENDFHTMNIYTDISYMKFQFSLGGYSELILNKIKYGLYKSKEYFKNKLLVKPMKMNWVLKPENIKELSIEKWDKNIFNSAYTNLNELGYDLFVFIKLSKLNKNELAKSGPRYLDINNRPLVGVIEINNNIKLIDNLSDEHIVNLFIHEMTHVLGFIGSFIYRFFPYNILNKKVNLKNNIIEYYINSTKVTSKYLKFFQNKEKEGIKLEDTKNNNLIGSHWDNSIIQNNKFNKDKIYSLLNLALLEESTWYKIIKSNNEKHLFIEKVPLKIYNKNIYFFKEINFNESALEECTSNCGYLDGDTSIMIDLSSYMNNIKYFSNETNHYYKCFYSVENCDECIYENYINCTKCNENFCLIDGTINKCYNETEIKNTKEYFLENEKYYLCKEGVLNCKKCNSKNECIECIDGYVLFMGQNECKSGIINNELYGYKIENTLFIYYPCNELINNCTKCENENKCRECETNFYFLDDDYTKCNSIDFLSNQIYYQYSSLMYYTCSKKFENCYKCFDDKNCIECFDGCTNGIRYCFTNGIPENYFKTSEGFYEKCSYYIPNCYNCENENACLSCIKPFAYKRDSMSCEIVDNSQLQFYFGQAEIIENRLKIYLIFFTPVDKDFFISINVIFFFAKRRLEKRKLAFDYTNEYEFYPSVKSDGNKNEGRIIEFTNNENKFEINHLSEEDYVIIQNITYSNGESKIKINNIPNNTNSLNISSIKSKFFYEDIDDLYNSESPIYKIRINNKTKDGCNFNFTIDDFENNENIKNIKVLLTEAVKKKDLIEANCIVDGNQAKCKLKVTVDGYYYVNYNVYKDSNLGVGFYIYPLDENNKYYFNCKIRLLPIYAIVLICVGGAGIVGGGIFYYEWRKKRKRKKKIQKIEQFQNLNSKNKVNIYSSIRKVHF